MYHLKRNRFSQTGRQSLFNVDKTHNLNSRHEFYELELALVYDVITSPNDEQIVIEDGVTPDEEAKIRASYLGAIRCRPLVSFKDTPIDDLPIAYPFDANRMRLPIPNEMVVVSIYRGTMYYETLNLLRNINYQSIEQDENQRSLGDEFTSNSAIFSLIPNEGDVLFQGRFGNSIRIGAYAEPTRTQEPQILIRNGQDSQKTGPTANQEDINADGGVIHMTSGDETKSPFTRTTTIEIGAFTNYPSDLKGNQILLNSDRIVISSKQSEIIGHGKTAIGWITDGVFSVDSKGDINISTPESNMNLSATNVSNVVPDGGKIYLGWGVEEAENQDEPVIKGNTLLKVLNQILDKLGQLTVPTATGPSGTPVNFKPSDIQTLKNNLKDALSRTTFTK